MSSHISLDCSTSSNLSTPYTNEIRWGFLYVCQSLPVLSFTPRKQKYPPPLHPAPPSPSASTRLWSAPAATLERWQSEGRESGEGGIEERKGWQLLNKCGGLGESVREGGEREESAILMMSSSPWEEGGGDICSVKKCWSWVKRAHTCCFLFTHTE